MASILIARNTGVGYISHEGWPRMEYSSLGVPVRLRSSFIERATPEGISLMGKSLSPESSLRPHCGLVPQRHSLSSMRRTSASSYRRRRSQLATATTRGTNVGNTKIDNCRVEMAANLGMVGKQGSEALSWSRRRPLSR